jgi:hypothetical protein
LIDSLTGPEVREVDKLTKAWFEQYKKEST